MNLDELQDVVYLILNEEGLPTTYVCPVIIYPYMTRFYGYARSMSGVPIDIRVSKRWFVWNKITDEFATSIIIHEACHIVCFYRGHKEKRRIPLHGDEFMELSNKWHAEFGLRENRRSARFHGIVYSVAANGVSRRVPEFEPVL